MNGYFSKDRIMTNITSLADLIYLKVYIGLYECNSNTEGMTGDRLRLKAAVT